MANTKHYVLTSITLGLIAAASALLIGGSNMLTKERIAKNEQDNIYKGISYVFGDSAVISSDSDIASDTYKYVEHVYEISLDNVDYGYAFKTTGSNMYGKVSLIIGLNLNGEYLKMKVITDEQTYASTLEKKYIDQLNEGNRDIDDVSCGATYGAKLVREMINEAKQAASEKVWK